jgi:hypothetical protein
MALRSNQQRQSRAEMQPMTRIIKGVAMHCRDSTVVAAALAAKARRSKCVQLAA